MHMPQKVLLALILNYPQLTSCGTNYDKNYLVIKHNEASDFLGYSEDHSNSTLYKVRADNIDYKCWIPFVLDDEETARKHDMDNIQTELKKREAISVIKNFNFQWRDRFVSRNGGYWSYQLRFDYDIRQYHDMGARRENGEPMTVDFKLAAWTDHDQDISLFSKPSYQMTDEKNPYKSELDFEMRTSEDGKKYVTQRIANGEICDLTGLPRSVTINYLCNDKVTVPTIRNVHEWKTCEYSLELESDYFCGHDMWTLPKELISNNVDCYPDMFQGIVSRTFDLEKMSLKPLTGGIFMGWEGENAVKFNLILTKNYRIKDEDSEDDETNNSHYHHLLMDISLGFQTLIRNVQLWRGSERIKWNTIFKLVTELYDIDRSYVGNIQLEQDENGYIVSSFTDEQVPEQSNFVDSEVRVS